MYRYIVTFGNGSKFKIDASSPKAAWERASEIGIVAHIKLANR